MATHGQSSWIRVGNPPAREGSPSTVTPGLAHGRTMTRPGAVRRPVLPCCSYITRLRVAVSRNHAALSLGVRFCVLKSTCTSPKRSPYPCVHSKLSIALHWK